MKRLGKGCSLSIATLSALVPAFLAMAPAPAQAQANCFAASPLAQLTITSRFGQRLHRITGTWRPHYGVDLRATPGTTLYAPIAGRVTLRGPMGTGAGNSMILRNPQGAQITAMHLNGRYFFELGADVPAGAAIAQTGGSGYGSDQPHLHLEYRPDGKKPVNPLPYLCPAPAISPGAGAVTDATHRPMEGDNPGQEPDGTTPPPPVGGGTQQETGRPYNPADIPITFPTWRDISMHDFLNTEVQRRFGNPQWLNDIFDSSDQFRANPNNAGLEPPPPADPKLLMLREISIMMSLEDLMQVERQALAERLEAAWAQLLAINAKAYTEKMLGLARSAANTSNKR